MADTKAAESGKAQSKTHPCACMTGTSQKCTEVTEGKFARGHDARMSSRLANLVAVGKLDIDKAEEHLRKAGGGDLLAGKMRRAAERLKELKDKPATPRKSGGAKATKPAKAATTADEQATSDLAKANSKNKVTVYHGKRKYEAVAVTDASGTPVLRHTFAGKPCDHDVDE